MKNNRFNTLIKNADKIKKDDLAKATFIEPILEYKKIRFREFKLYYTLLETRGRGWGFIDIICVAFFSFAAFIAIIGRNEQAYFLYFQIISIFGALFFITKVFLLKPIVHTFRYVSFKKWMKNSKIKVVGWDKVYNNDELLTETNWYQQCSVFIKLDASCSPITKTLIDAAMVVFVDNAKWVQNLFDGSTAAWELNENKLVGSANCSVLGNIQRLINHDLSAINDEYGGIVSVEIKSDEKMIYVMKSETYSSGM